ncbi:putative Snf7 [Trypanosoma vivax]|uniref:Putative SNF-7-like protein n=1 Tax=Trypanosoma vivax (strain Y486) TaxID=1055687 RepID=G0U633_TRYVY|nr:putative SNF-7-like protein [Trypanosoma vivax]KAH8608258.1 putative Snf7 [Trypanosoma vivax]CCC51335.1 putative SNF-7-like protein [Trypanosoma vivax Y486]
MQRLFGRAKETPKPTLEEASMRLDTRSEAVDARLRKLDAELAKMHESIKKSSGPTQQRYKQRALQLLQQKRMYQNQQDAIMQQQFSMDQLQFTTEAVKDTKVQMEVIRDLTKSLKKDFKNMSLSSVENMQEELRDLYEDTQYIQEVMGRSYDVPEDIDEDDLLGELEALSMEAGNNVDSSYLEGALALPSCIVPHRPGKQEAPNQQSSENVAGDAPSLEEQLGL